MVVSIDEHFAFIFFLHTQQMYGEKIEENEELRLDLVDVKEMYKIQVILYVIFVVSNSLLITGFLFLD
jgi:hypothetical protein